MNERAFTASPTPGIPILLVPTMPDGQVWMTDAYPVGRACLIGTKPHPWHVTEVRRIVEEHLGDVCAWAGVSTGPRTHEDVLTALRAS